MRLRYVQLFKTRFTPRVGRTLRVRVSSDAKQLTWRLGSRSGTGRPPLLRIPAPTQPGRYTLTVTANGHRARATVVVRAALANLPGVLPLAASLERAVTDAAEILLAAGVVLALAYALLRSRIGILRWPLLSVSVLALVFGTALGAWAWHENRPRDIRGSATEEFSETLRTETAQAKPKTGKKKKKRCSRAGASRSSGRRTATTRSARTSLPAGAGSGRPTTASGS